MKTDKENCSPLVGQNIRTARKSAGLTLNDLSQQIGISVQALSAIERGSANPSRQTLISLARVLEDDFGEPGLKRYATGARTSTHRQMLSKVLTERKAKQPVGFRSLDELILQRALEVQEAANLPRPIRITNQKSALMPIHYEVIEGASLKPYEGEDTVVVPFSLIPSIERVMCVRVKGSPIRDALVCPEDILVLSERSLPDQGTVVLALVESLVVIKRWELRGRKVIFTSVDADCDSLIVPRNKVEFIGELTGVLRFISLNPVLYF